MCNLDPVSIYVCCNSLSKREQSYLSSHLSQTIIYQGIILNMHDRPLNLIDVFASTNPKQILLFNIVTPHKSLVPVGVK